MDDEVEPDEGGMDDEPGSELFEGDAYDAVLEELDSQGSHRLSFDELSGETLRAASADAIMPPLEAPPEPMEDDLVEERWVPPGEETTVSDKPVLPPSFPLRVLLWNIADLGGGPSGTLPVRKQWTISALAHVIRVAKPDVATILELKKKGGARLVEPKRPVPMQQNAGRSGSGKKLAELVRLARHFVEPGGYNVKYAAPNEVARVTELEAALLNDLARFFSARVRRTIWPGFDASSSPDPGWSDLTRSLGDDTLARLDENIEKGWGACEPELVERFGRPRRKAAEDTDEDKDPRLVALDIDVNKRPEHKLKVYRLLCVRLLVEEGYYDWLQPYHSRYEANEKKKGEPGAEERVKRNDLAELAVSQLRLHCGMLFQYFLAIVGGLAPEKPPSVRQIGLENILHRANDEHLQRVYEAKYADYLERKNDTEDAPETHAGLREFLRIRDELNAQCEARGEESYASWPETVPDQPIKGLYTQDEAYGVLWRKSKVEVDATAISYLSAYVARRDSESAPLKMEVGAGQEDAEAAGVLEMDEGGEEEDAETASPVKSLFSKREPLRIPVRLAKVKDAPAVGVVAWHPPAPGDRNKEARGRDFPTFLQYCKDERREKSLGVILSDLNIDTARPKKERAPDETPYIDTCIPRLSFHQFFATLLGPGADASHLYTQADQRSTIAKSVFDDWAVNSKHDFGGGSHQLLRTLLNEHINPAVFAPIKTAKGHELQAPLTSGEELLGYIESFVTPPQQRYGASGYDKILVYSPRADGWTLKQSSVFVIPFPMALADAKEEGLFFIHGKLLPTHLQPFWRLIQTEDGELPEEERIFDKLRGSDVKLMGSDDARWEALMVAAKKLSDHMPLVSDLQLVYNGQDALVIEEEPLLLPTGSPELEALEALCLAFQKSMGSAEEATRALDDILEAAARVPEADHPRAGALVADAMQVRETLDVLRAEGFDTADFWGKRPVLESDGGGRGAANGVSLDTYLTFIGQARVPNAGGGNCLFRTLSQLLFGTERHHADVRQAVVNHLDDLLAGTVQDDGGLVGPLPVAAFRQHMELMLDWHREAWPNQLAYRRVVGTDEWRQYLRAMSRDGVWGDHVALAAASHLFGVRFDLHARTSNASYWTDLVDFVPRTEGHEAARTLLIANLGNTHYEAVGPMGAALPEEEALPPVLIPLCAPRRRAEEGVPQPAQKSEAKASSSPTQGASSSPLKGPVHLWPSTTYFKKDTPAHHLHALFLFGENDVEKKKSRQQKSEQHSTQAVIRLNPNALGIRTCWFSGVGMLDKDLARNQQAIDEDCDEALQLLKSGAYMTLVVPWDHTTNTVDIGTGVADLPAGAPQTWAHLQKKIQELIDWANARLGTVMVVPQAAVLVPSVVQQQASDLYMQEVSDAMLKAPALGDDSSTSVVGASNVVSLRTLLFSGASSPETGLLSDVDYEKNKAMLDEDLEELSRRVESGQFRRLVLPRDEEHQIVLGTELGRLDVNAPRTLDYLRKRLEALCKRCEEIHVIPASALMEDEDREDGNGMQGVQESQSLSASGDLPAPNRLKRTRSDRDKVVFAGEEEEARLPGEDESALKKHKDRSSRAFATFRPSSSVDPDVAVKDRPKRTRSQRDGLEDEEPPPGLPEEDESAIKKKKEAPQGEEEAEEDQAGGM
ncbi:OTU domain-containing protein [Pyxidicoccus sp. MSG2]|uniref:OTU domain-containing protein n=1 Tax=Pyxidicoccus sp. MSG2 TaxID=2996790 RepID=UPI00226EAE0B|nr:hypothetical protein [Pyxidicoccus sp. MSG2]MCY1020096.1 hypothetical protein [Pyxidicoccus sp. MSG2]